MKLRLLLLLSIFLIVLSSSVFAITYTAQYPPSHSATYVKVTTSGGGYFPYDLTDPADSLTGTVVGNGWQSATDAITNQRLHIDLGSAKVIRRVYYENYHHIGTDVNAGMKNYILQGSNSNSSFLELTYATDTGWTTILSGLQMVEHTGSDVADPQYDLINNTVAYRYYAFKVADNHGRNYMGSRYINLQTEDGWSPLDTTPPTFNETPSNQTPEFYFDSLWLDINATDETGFDTFFINDTGNFNISDTGILRNISQMSEKIHVINISINDTSGNNNSFLLYVNVNDTISPSIINISDNVTLEYLVDSLYADINGSDPSGLNTTPYRINDTTNFNISNEGLIRNVTGLSIKTYIINITIIDGSNNQNINSTLFSITIQDTTNPDITFVYPINNTHYNDYNGSIIITLNEVGGNCSLNNSDWDYLSDNTTMYKFINNTGINEGIYNINVSCWDTYLNNGSKILVFIIDTTNPIRTPIHPTTTQYNTTNNITYQSNWSDTNLYRVNVTLYNQSNNIISSKLYDQINTTNQSVYIPFNFTTGEGNYTIEDCGTDDHTFGSLRGLTYDVNYDGISFSNGVYTKKIYGGYWNNNQVNLFTPQIIQQYNISFKVINTGNGEYKFDMSFNKPLEDYLFGFAIPKSNNLFLRNPDIGHFVWKDWYVDFKDLIGNNFPITIKNTPNYYLIYTSTSYCNVNVGEKCILDPAVGGLNEVCENTTIQYLYLEGNLDLLFFNTTNSSFYKTTFYENEPFRLYSNYTDEFGLVMNYSRGKCNITLPNGTNYGLIYDSGRELWELYYFLGFTTSGNKNIQGECSNKTNSVRYITINETITILNILPIITFNNISYIYGVLNLTSGMNISNVSGVFVWDINISDDDLDIINYSVYNTTGTIIFSNQTNTTISFETPEGLFYRMENPYNLTVFANDTDGDTTQLSILFNIILISRTLNYVNRTPPNNSIQIGNSVWIEVDYLSDEDNDDNISNCIIQFDGINYSGNIVVDYCYEQFVGLVDGINYSFNVYMNDTNNLSFVVGYRLFTENSIQPPINITSIIFNDSVVESNEDLLCTANITGNDPEGNTTLFNLTLFVNSTIINETQSVDNNITILNINYNRGDVIYCQVKLYDGYEYTNATNNSITISNSIPYVLNVTINGTFIGGILYSNMSVTGNYTFYDNDSDSDLSHYGFWVNTTFYNTTPNTNISYNYTSRYDVVKFMVTPYDGFNYGNPLNSSSMIVYGVPPTIHYLSPNQGYFSKYIPIECYASNDDNDQVYYYIDMYYNNGTNITWHSILNNSTIGGIMFSLKNISTQNNISIRCNATIDYTTYVNKTTTGAIAFVDKPEGELIYIGAREIIHEKLPYRLGIICDVRNSNTNLSVYGSWGDCGNDGLKDYYWKESDISVVERKRTLHQFTCVSLEGLEEVSAGCIFEKTNINNTWIDVCEGLPYTEQLCTYKVGIFFEVFER